MKGKKGKPCRKLNLSVRLLDAFIIAGLTAIAILIMASVMFI